MPKSIIEEQADAQVVYMEYLLEKAKFKVREPGAQLAFDPQERVLVNVTLQQAELNEVLAKMNQKAKPKHYATLEEALGRAPTPEVTVSLDTSLEPQLHKQFNEQMSLALQEAGLSQTETHFMLNHLDALPKGSIIALQQEFHFHLGLCLRLYQEVAKDKLIGKEAQMQAAYEEALAEVSKLVMRTYAKALIESMSASGFYVDFSKVNQRLDEARTAISPQAHSLFMEKIIEKTGLVLKNEDLKQASDGSTLKQLAKQTSATPNDVIHTENRMGLITWVGGSNYTSHDRVEGTQLSDRQIITHVLSAEGAVCAGSHNRIHIRVPSPVLKTGLIESAYSADVALKLAYIRDSYGLEKSLEATELPRAYIYNSYTAINHFIGDLGGNLQTQSAIHILHGAHQYNAMQLLKAKPVFCFVQNISVNGFGDSLGYTNANPLKKESTLMTELAVLHTIFPTLSDADKDQVVEIINLYTSYLGKDVVRQPYFSASLEGKLAIQKIQSLKQSWRIPSSVEEIEDPVKACLKNLMAHDLHCQHEFSKLFQALSVYAEQASIGGCKSGNERTQAINGRVVVLERILNHESFASDELEVQKQLANLASGKDTRTAAKNLKRAIDYHYNKRGLQAASSLVSLLDQGAAAKVEGSSELINLSTNQAEESSTIMTNLHQSHAGEMQAHKQLTHLMQNAWKGHPQSLWSRIKSNPIALVGAVLIVPLPFMAVYVYFDNKRRMNDNKDIQFEAQKRFVEQSKNPPVTGLALQIGHYKEKNNQPINDFVKSKLSTEGLNNLYQGIDAYQQRRAEKIARFEETFKQTTGDSNDPQYFRKAFVALIKEIESNQAKKFTGDPELRKKKPEEATIGMKNFLGKRGMALYKLALEEEMYSQEYRDALFQTCTTHYDGERWVERPVFIVSGSSGSGKSTVCKILPFRAGEDFLSTVPGTNEGNDLVSVDGGKTREVSQMRKLVIQAANNKGYSGIKNLHKQSKILNRAKYCIMEAALATQSLGLMIPETFTGWFNPMDKVRHLMERIDALPNTKLIFARVTGKDSNFSKVVAFMGSRRAWKTDNFVSQPLDLNKEDVTESKDYVPEGFIPGQLGSYLAEKWYLLKSKFKCSLLIVNDLRLLKKNPKDSSEWIDAEQGDEGAALFSNRVFEAWCRLDKNKRPSLEEYNRKNAKLIIYSSVLSTQIKTLKQELIPVQVYQTELSKKEDQSRQISEMEAPYSVYYSSFLGKPESECGQMKEKYQKMSEEYAGVIKELENNKKIIEAALKKMDVEALDKDKAQLNELIRDLRAESDLINNYLKIYKKAHYNIVSQEGIIQGIEAAKQGKPYEGNQDEQVVCTLKSRDTAEQEGQSESPAVVTVAPGNTYLSDEIPEDKVRVYDVKYKSKSSPDGLAESVGSFTEESLPDAKDKSKVLGRKFVVKQFPQQRAANAVPEEQLIEEKIYFALTMASQILATMDQSPSPDKPIVIKGGKAEALGYLWTAFVILGNQHPKMKFDADAIVVDSAHFDPSSEYVQGKGFKKSSLYGQISQHPNVQQVIRQKLQDQNNLINARSVHGTIKEAGEAPVPSSSAIKQNLADMQGNAADSGLGMPHV